MLQGVRTEGDWEAWLSFFARGVRQTAEQAFGTAQRLVALFAEDRRRIGELGRVAGSSLRVQQAFQQQPILSIAAAKKRTGLTVPTVATAIKNLEDVGVVRELTGKRRNRLFAYDQYLRILNEGTTSPPDSPSR